MPLTGTVTLAQAAMEEKEPLKKGMILGLAMEGLVADIAPWRTIGTLRETGVRYDEVPLPDYIPLDGSITSKSAKGHQVAASISEMAMHIDIPIPLEDQAGDQLTRQSVRQVMLTQKGAAAKLNDTFINGDIGSDPNAFDGLNKLVAELGSSQTIGSTEIDLTASYTDALAYSVFERIDEGIHACEGHMPDAVFANDTLLKYLRNFGRRLRLSGNDFNWMTAKYDINDPRRTQRTKSTRPAFIYQDIPFYDVGTTDLAPGSTNRIIGNTYSEGGATSTATRLFMVKFGAEDLEPIQASGPQIINIGPLEDKDVTRKRFKWLHGLALWGPRSIVKVQGLTVT